MEVKGEEIVNRVNTSGLVTLDLESFYTQGERIQLDIAPQLFQGVMLREKEFRDFIKNHQWENYSGKLVAVFCSAEAVVPTWAYMLVSIALTPFAKHVIFGSLGELEIDLFRKQLEKVNWSDYKDAKVVVKGCSKIEVPLTLYVEVANKLQPVVSSLMFGEPCSTVPLYKRKK